MDRLSPQDASFLHIEDSDPGSLMHIGSLGIFEGPPPGFVELRDMVAGKLPLVPRYRQRVRRVPYDVGRPVWADDPHFNLSYHLRHSALPRPGSYEQLRATASRIMSQHLDRTRPLWEIWMIEGLEEDHWALLSKTHHCLVDGVSGTDLLTVILDESPEGTPPIRDAWRPHDDPTDVRLLSEAVADIVASPYEQWRRARAATRLSRRAVRAAGDLTRATLSSTGLMRRVPESSLIGPIGPQRRWGWARASMADVKTVRGAFGGTVNDVVLTAIGRGFHDLLVQHGEPPDRRVVRSLVPVSVRRPNERGSYNNRVSAMVAELPVGVEDPVARLEAVKQQMDGLKESRQAVAAETLVSLSGFAPPLLLALGTRAATRTAQQYPRWQVNTVTTNVPGPRHPLYAVGRRMVEALPYVPTAAPMRIGVAIFSYDGQLSFGVNADWEAIPDVDVFCRGIEAGMTELTKAAQAAGSER